MEGFLVVFAFLVLFVLGFPVVLAIGITCIVYIFAKDLPIDLVAQRQLRLETSGAAYTALSARYAQEIDRLFGTPGGAGSLDGAVNAFTAALQTLASDPSSFSGRSGVLDATERAAATS